MGSAWARCCIQQWDGEQVDVQISDWYHAEP